DENGVRTVIEYTTNDEGKRITRRTKRTLQKSVVDHQVAERKKWSKFGQERGNKAGPDPSTTTVAEVVSLTLAPGNTSSEPEEKPADAAPKLVGRKVVCRLCKGQHFTAKCPYKDQLGGLDAADAPPPDDDTPAGEPSAAAAGKPGPGGGPGTGGVYVPPSLRAGGRAAGESMRGAGGRDDLPTLRVTNISEDTQENDLRELFGVFGRVARVYVGRDRETGQGKGFAFVSFEDRAIAQRAMEKVHGKGYDNLILSVQWSREWFYLVLVCWGGFADASCRAEARAALKSACYRPAFACCIRLLVSQS
ncbi:eukaryotic translation initiation factor 3 subunit G-domain-containing protein, partial [Schizophyllum fasciatum]